MQQVVIRVVDLPAPLAPIMATISPGKHLEGNPFQGFDGTVAGIVRLSVRESGSADHGHITPSLQPSFAHTLGWNQSGGSEQHHDDHGGIPKTSMR
jgi:hypothetical protein